MPSLQPLSVDPGGVWSPRQARAVLDVLQVEAQARGLDFKVIEITTMGGPRRVRLTPYCVRHQEPVLVDAICPRCGKEPRDS